MVLTLPVRLTPFKRGAIRARTGLMLAFAGAYVLASVSAYAWTVGPNGLAVLWMCNGILAAGFLRLPVASAAILAAVAFLADILSSVYIGNTAVGQSGLIASLDVVEAYVAATLIRRHCGVKIDLTDMRRFVALMLRAAVPSTILVGTTGTLISHWLFGYALWPNGLNWVGGDFLGMMIGAPVALLLSGSANSPRTMDRSSLSQFAMLTGSLSLSGIVFLLDQGQFFFLILPIVALSTFVMSPKTLSLMIIALSLLASVLTISEFGPFRFDGQQVAGPILMLQLFLVSVTISALTMMCAITGLDQERRRQQRASLSATTARRQAEASAAQAAESEARYRIIADNVADIILRYDAKGVLEYVSPSVREVGYEPEDLIGQPVHSLILPLEEESGGVDTPITSPSPGQRDNEFQLRGQGGQLRWVQVNASPIRDEAGETIALVSVVRDISSHREMEEALRRKQLEAEAATVAKSEFLANMSHEIRTPLNAVIGFGGLLDRLDGLSDKARDYVKQIVTAGRSLLGVVDSVLEFSRLEAAGIELNTEPFELSLFLEDTIAMCRSAADAKGLGLALQLDADLPAVVSADAGRLRQVLLNLLGNAVKFTERGRVTLSCSRANTGCLRFAVTDTGIGIAAEQTHRLFQRFSQIDGSRARHHGGSGLGLAICKALVEAMDGEIGVESVPMQGATFWIMIKAPAAEWSDEAQVAPSPEMILPELNILVVDDTATNRDLIITMLGGFDLELTEAASGLEAVTAAQRDAFDLILMDVQMPGMDGLEATQAIRATSKLNRATPIVAITGNVLPQHVELCLEAGMNDHIGKPVDVSELLSKITHWVEPDADKGVPPATAQG